MRENGYLLFVIIFIIIILLISAIPAMTVNTYTVEIIKTEISSDDDYMIFCKDIKTNKVHTFTLNDSLWHWSWRTADLYASIEPGKIYNIKVSGWRIPFFSCFPNIFKCSEVV